jgi:hypothetical protein
MVFDANSYGPGVAKILALDGDGRRAMPLVIGGARSDEARASLQGRSAGELFAGSRAPEAALSGLWLYFSFFDEAHSIAQDIHTPDGSYWHGILHRQEPDPGNAGYWFRRVGRHPIFPALRDEAERVLSAQADRVRFAAGGQWDPFAFIDFCEYARQRPGSGDERAAQEIQIIEWQLLFDYCARPA